jgi:hypothetical protein
LTLYLNLIADRLPNTVPVSLININVIIQYNTSCFVVLMTILTVWMYKKQEQNEPVPKCWRRFKRITDFMCCWKSDRKQRQIRPQSEKDFQIKEIDDVITDYDNMQKVPRKEVRVTWSDVNQSANRFLFKTTLSFLCLQIVVYCLMVLVRFF